MKKVKLSNPPDKKNKGKIKKMPLMLDERADLIVSNLSPRGIDAEYTKMLKDSTKVKK